nr:MFS transporter [Bacteroidota bacterium]
MAVMGVASITPAFPKIKEALGIDNQQIGLLITIFTLPGIFLNPVLGVLADRFGRKTILIPSLFLFALAGVACGFTRDFDLLLVFRFFQGIGAASLGAINVTLIGDFYQGRQRAAAMGANASVLSIGTAAYPAVGGAVAMFGWYYPFFFPVLAIPVGLWVIFSLKNPILPVGQPFFKYLKGVSQYLVNRNVIALFLISIFTFIILYGSYLTYLPLLLNDKFGAEPYQIGIILSFGSIATAVTSPYLGRLSARFNFKVLLIFANALYFLSMIIIPVIGLKWLMLIPAAIFGMAMGINIPGVHTLLAGSAPMQYRAAFMSVNGMVLRIGQTLGPVLAGMAYVVAGMTGAFYTGAAAAVVMVFLILFLAKEFLLSK